MRILGKIRPFPFMAFQNVGVPSLMAFESFGAAVLNFMRRFSLQLSPMALLAKEVVDTFVRNRSILGAATSARA